MRTGVIERHILTVGANYSTFGFICINATWKPRRRAYLIDDMDVRLVYEDA